MCPLHEHLRGDLEQHSGGCCQLGTPDLHMAQAVLCQSKIWFSTQSAAAWCRSPSEWTGKGRERILGCVGHQWPPKWGTHRTCLSSSTRGNTRSCVYKANTDFSVSCLYLCSGQTKRAVCIFLAQEQIEFMIKWTLDKSCLFVPFFLSSSKFTLTINTAVWAVRKIQIR